MFTIRYGRIADGVMRFGRKDACHEARNRVAVITGAGSGIGRATALALARRGCHLALADIDEGRPRRTAREVLGPRACAPPPTGSTWPTASRARLPRGGAPTSGRQLLVNNAGVALGGTFEQVSEEDFDWLMDINFHGVVRMTRAFLPLLQRERRGAHRQRISSIYGIVSPPGQAPIRPASSRCAASATCCATSSKAARSG
jgi:NAD(P)-dependent dehydrogenase (short-subunit alcohol dehydrogenase family)